VEFDRGGQAFSAATINISSRGFYCIVDRPVGEGEELRCLVNLTEGQIGQSLSGVSLNCEVVVLRSEPRGAARGIACWIKNYTVVRPASDVLQ
jgi:hypothetical protein